jgi:hypothetical protein
VFSTPRIHDPRIGYDSVEHILYMQTLSHGRLPRQADSNEFFSPPLPYIPGALAMRLGVSPANALRTNQYAQVAFSILLTWFLLQLAGRSRATIHGWASSRWRAWG